MATTTTSSFSTTHTASATRSTSGVPSPTGTPSQNQDGGQKSLLFFVALGFGVVFTNLWIIVGVKYCFRYNRRQRQALMQDEQGQPMDMGNLQRPRRRREKKLMTMEEVNERFPLTKYKLWRSTREQSGLPANGGITAPPSRAASIREAIDPVGSSAANEHGVPVAGQTDPSIDAQDFAALPRQSINTRTSGKDAEKKSSIEVTTREKTVASRASLDAKPDATETIEEAEEDDDDPIRNAVPTELLTQPGDACAICLDTLDDDDEVRGLSCGHAFHAGCIDPWLTSRRACCPLCKADYYVPKPRDMANEAADGTTRGHRRHDQQINEPSVAFTGRPGFRPRLVLAGQRFHFDHNDPNGTPVYRHIRQARRAGNTSDTANNTDASTGEDSPEVANTLSEQDINARRPWISRFPRPSKVLPRWPRRNANNNTPVDVEAGAGGEGSSEIHREGPTPAQAEVR